jgi:hypothetical protein
LVRSHRFQISLATASGVCVLVAFSALALAQARDVECRKTETQPECHARLKCNPNEELEDCQKRLLKCTANEKLDECEKRVGSTKDGNAGQRDDANKGNDRDADQTRRDRDNPDRERGERNPRDDGDRSRRQRGERGDDGDHRRGHTHGFQANKTFGLGLELGEPTGFNGKYFVSETGALDFGVGYIYDTYYYGDGFHIYADYLWHPVSLVSAPAFELPFYVGAGLRYWDFHYCYMGLCDYGGSAIGIRVPVGIAFDFNNVPLDIFIQLVPVIDFVNGNYYDRYRDRSHLGIDLSVGIRYWFK